jgi:hypothetical protein
LHRRHHCFSDELSRHNSKHAAVSTRVCMLLFF